MSRDYGLTPFLECKLLVLYSGIGGMEIPLVIVFRLGQNLIDNQCVLNWHVPANEIILANSLNSSLGGVSACLSSS